MAGRKRRKLKNSNRHCSLLISLVISALVMTIWSYVQLNGLYSSYVYDPLEHTVIAVTMQGIHDGVYPWEAFKSFVFTQDHADSAITEEPIPVSEDVSVTDDTNDTYDTNFSDEISEIASDDAVEAVSADEVIPSDSDMPMNDDVVQDDIVRDEAAVSAPDVQAGTGDEFMPGDETEVDTEHVEKEFITVDDDYFRDALFIGDSRMLGLSQYCEPIDTRADFYVKKALTIYNLLDGKPIKSFDGTQKSLWEVLDEKQYAKIYIMVGINEIGVGNSEYFKDAYSQVVDRIREEEPHAVIFINSIMHVSQVKSSSDNLYNNTNINARNDAIASLADNINIFYLNINEAVDDENGALRADLTFDEIHLRGSSYEPWHEYLLLHGIETEPVPEQQHVLQGHPVE